MRERFHRAVQQTALRERSPSGQAVHPPKPRVRDAATENEPMKTGTTTVGLKTERGVLIATDMRASLGGQLVVNKNVQKVEQVHPTAAMTLVGSVGEAQWFIRTLRCEANIYEFRHGEQLDIAALQQLAGTLAQSSHLRSIMPILGGVDDDGGHIASIGPTGGVIDDNYIATGSGMQLAYGCLEERYEPNLSDAQARRLAAKTIRSASNRDTASGNGIYLAEISDEGVDIHSHEDISELL